MDLLLSSRHLLRASFLSSFQKMQADSLAMKRFIKQWMKRITTSRAWLKSKIVKLDLTPLKGFCIEYHCLMNKTSIELESFYLESGSAISWKSKIDRKRMK